jgi:molybdopterin molybdotransferase
VIPFAEALTRLLGRARPVGVERVGLAEAAERVLAEDLVARAPLPFFDYSAMDGYALCRADLADGGPTTLPVLGESAAGSAPGHLTPGSACRIFTGAPLPAGADAVVPQEDVSREGDAATFPRAPAAGAFVRRRGADLTEGALALRRGARLGPGQLALAAGLDRPHLLVARRPSVSILATGDELRAPGEPGPLGSIPESNAYFVAAAARLAGATARVGPFVPDRLEAARAAVNEALAGADLLVTIGGVSVGDHDVVRPALEAAGVSLDFWRVAMKPGKPLAVGHLGDTLVLGLPGNPASASLTFLLFGIPLLRALAGEPRPLPRRRRLPIDGSLARSPGREEFLRARLDVGDEGTRARLLPNQASGAVTSFAEADALVVVPAAQGRVEAGERLEVIELADVYR